MEAANIIIFTGLIALLVLTGLLRSRKVHTENQYLLAGRKTGLFALCATLVMTEFNPATLIAFSSVGYSARWWGITLPCVFLFGLLFYALTVAKKWKNFNGISVAHYFSERYGTDVGILAAVILFIAMAGFSATYVKALTLIFAPVLPQLNLWLLSALLVLIILIMTLRGGLTAIIRIDRVSFIIVLIFFPLLLFHTIHLATTAHAKTMTLTMMQQALPIKFILSLILLTMFSYILAPWYGQKVISAKSPQIAWLAVAIAAVFIFILYGLGIAITSLLATKGIALAQSQQALPYAIRYVLPAGWQGLGYAVLFLTAATTLSGMWNAMVTLLVGESHLHAKQIQLRRSIFWMSICALLSWLLANIFVDQILNKMILANIPVIALSFALLAGFYWKKANRLGVYVSVICGLIIGTGCYFYYGEKNIYTWYWAMYGIPFIFISGIVGSLWGKQNINQ